MRYNYCALLCTLFLFATACNSISTEKSEHKTNPSKTMVSEIEANVEGERVHIQWLAPANLDIDGYVVRLSVIEETDASEKNDREETDPQTKTTALESPAKIIEAAIELDQDDIDQSAPSYQSISIAVESGDYQIDIYPLDKERQELLPSVAGPRVRVETEAESPDVPIINTDTNLLSEDSVRLALSWNNPFAGLLDDGTIAEIVSYTLYWAAGEGLDMSNPLGKTVLNAQDEGEHSYNIDGLIPKTTYTIVLITKNNLGLRARTALVIKTAASKSQLPAMPVISTENIVTMTNIKGSSISMQWDAPFPGLLYDGSNAAIKHYKVYWRQETVNINDAAGFIIVLPRAESKGGYIVIDDLEPGVSYAIIIEVFNTEDRSARSSMQTIKTPEPNSISPPDPVLKVTTRIIEDRVGVELTWLSPEIFGNNVDGTLAQLQEYHIYWERGVSRDVFGKLTVNTQGAAQKVIAAGNSSAVIERADGLEGGTLYSIAIMSVSNATTPPELNSNAVRSAAAIVQVVTKDFSTAPDEVVDIKQDKQFQSKDSLLLRWKGGAEGISPNGDQAKSNYEIIITRHGTYTSAAEILAAEGAVRITSTTNEIEVQHLLPDQKYDVVVTALNSKAADKRSSWVMLEGVSIISNEALSLSYDTLPIAYVLRESNSAPKWSFPAGTKIHYSIQPLQDLSMNGVSINADTGHIRVKSQKLIKDSVEYSITAKITGRYGDSLIRDAVFTITDIAPYNCAYIPEDKNQDAIYEIDTYQQLQYVDKFDLNASYMLTQDIDVAKNLQDNCQDHIPNAVAKNFTPLGRVQNPFTGSFYGEGFTISGLQIHHPGGDYVALFGYVLEATIENISIAEADIRGRNYVGGLVGRAKDSIIIGSTRESTIVGAQHVGGLIGRAFASNSSGYASDGKVSGTNAVGGLVGSISEGSDIRGYAVMMVQGNTRVGGIAGESISSKSMGYSRGTTQGLAEIGGVIGYAQESEFTGYSRSTLVRVKGNKLSFGHIVGREQNVNNIIGYHALAVKECEMLDANTDIMLAGNTGTDGTGIIIRRVVDYTSANSYESAFSALSFGEFGQWRWMGFGNWPAINIAAVQKATLQPLADGMGINQGKLEGIERIGYTKFDVYETYSAKTEAKRLGINTPNVSIYPTGLYARAKAHIKVHVSIPSKMIVAGKLPRVIMGTPVYNSQGYTSKVHQLEVGENIILNITEFSQIIYIDFSSGDTHSNRIAHITISGATRLPYFILGEDADEFKKMLKSVDYEHVVLASNRIMLVAETSIVLPLIEQDWQKMLTMLDEAVRAGERFSGLDNTSALDREPSTRIMVVANTVETPSPSTRQDYILAHGSAATRWVSEVSISSDAAWNLWLRVAERQQMQHFLGEEAVISTLYALAIERDMKTGDNMRENNRDIPQYLALDQRDYSNIGSNIGDDNGGFFLKVGLYQQLFLAHATSFFPDLHKSIRKDIKLSYTDPAALPAKNDVAYFMRKASEVAGENLSAFFHAWGHKAQQAAYDAIEDLQLPSPAVDPSTLRE